MIDLSTLLPPISADPNSSVGRLLAAKNLPMTLTHRRVMGTRSLAHEVAERLPEGPVDLYCGSIDVLSTPFIDELLMLRDDVTFFNLNEEGQEALRFVQERRDGSDTEE